MKRCFTAFLCLSSTDSFSISPFCSITTSLLSSSFFSSVHTGNYYNKNGRYHNKLDPQGILAEGLRRKRELSCLTFLIQSDYRRVRGIFSSCSVFHFLHISCRKDGEHEMHRNTSSPQFCFSTSETQYYSVTSHWFSTFKPISLGQSALYLCFLLPLVHLISPSLLFPLLFFHPLL